VRLNAIQSAILMAVGVQHKTMDVLAKELDVPVSQLLALHNKCMHKMLAHFNAVCERAIRVSGLR